METRTQTPFKNQINATQKKMQMLKLREYIYNYLLQHGSLDEKEAYQIASKYPEHRINEEEGFQERDINYVNGRLEEIQKLQHEIYNIAI